MADYGVDCASLWTAGGACDLDPYFSQVSGPMAVIHAVTRRFVTPRGALPWDRTAGFDLRSRLNSKIANEAALFALRVQMEAEAEKDERVESATASVSFTPSTGVLIARVSLALAEGTFAFVLRASDVTVELLETLPSF